MYTSPNLRNNIASNNNELSFVQDVLNLFILVLVNLERKEITRNN